MDALDELDLLVTLALTGTGRARRGCCCAGCRPPSRTAASAWTPPRLETALRPLRRAGDAVRMEGFSFHLSGYAIQPRADLAGELVDLCLKARVLGLQADRISIGGGFAVDYSRRRPLAHLPR